MTEQVTDRELLWELAQKPLGSPELSREAEDNVHRIRLGRCKPSPELAETIQRTSKIWLPAGKRSTRDANEVARREALERQTDIEDAVEAAGGQRGGART